ncbi:hypothetical protein SeMB42_g06960 [Synchytrium endobioticum]|uniref:THIF-type NAD/FAD binding fold domain-containing protein n=1 Tax=Synchytrium endobioticum TaxID=286115 RepID=A0A507CHX2_9FUNG|nr:hypothetical protein SeMB42_g06960 [Synchytrium endobioticum]TPX46328.1 hypothetical protein SeLEV6574_g03288 [Synchytrium endobioticum]
MSSNKRTRSDSHVHNDDNTNASTKKLRTDLNASPAISNDVQHVELSQDDVALYDRQIRLWGMEAQQRMRNSKILIGGLTGITTEVCKNLVLAGIGTLTVVDASPVRIQDLQTEFFVTESDIGKNKAQAAIEKIRMLNPRVKVDAISKDVATMPESFFDGFDFVVLSGVDLSTMVRMDEICRKRGIKFYGAIGAGFQGLFFTDLIHHKFVLEAKTHPSAPKHRKAETNEFHYVSIENALTKTWGPIKGSARRNQAIPLYIAFLIVLTYQRQCGRYPTKTQDSEALSLYKASFLQSQSLQPNFIPDDQLWTISSMMGAELPGVAPVIGGVLSQDVIKTLAGKDEPVYNVFVHDGLRSIGTVLESIPRIESKSHGACRALVEEVMIGDD